MYVFFFCSTLSRLIFIKKYVNFLLEICYPKGIYYFRKTQVRAKNAILVIPYNNVVRIEGTALKWNFIRHEGCMNKKQR